MLSFLARQKSYAAIFATSVAISLMTQPVIAQNNIPLDDNFGHDHLNRDESCEDITSIVEKTFAMPEGILTAITRIEAGRLTSDGNREGWPWTINHAGKGLFFDSKENMLAYAENQLVDGDQNMDIGCMQISHYWHGDNFVDLDEMGDPFTNIAYAAAFLSDLEATHGSWDQAIRHYHNANPEQNTPYVNKVYAAWDNLGSAPIEILQNAIASDHHDPVGNTLPSTASLDAFPVDITVPDIILPDTPSHIEPALPEQPSAPADEVETVTVMAASEPDDPLATLKTKQPHLKGKWDKVKTFRMLLNP
jgi:hypothetical protein